LPGLWGLSFFDCGDFFPFETVRQGIKGRFHFWTAFQRLGEIRRLGYNPGLSVELENDILKNEELLAPAASDCAMVDRR
jgi:hypothetical protein